MNEITPDEFLELCGVPATPLNSWAPMLMYDEWLTGLAKINERIRAQNQAVPTKPAEVIEAAQDHPVMGKSIRRRWYERN